MRLEELQQLLQQQEEALVQANEQYQTLITTNHDYSMKITELGTKEMDAKSRRNDVFKQQIQLEQEVCRVLIFCVTVALISGCISKGETPGASKGPCY